MHPWSTARARGMLAATVMAVVIASGCTSGPVARRSTLATPSPTAAGVIRGDGRPGLATVGGRIYIGWAAPTTATTTATQRLDLGWSVDGGHTITRVIEPERVPAGEGPALAADGTGVDVAWPDANTADVLTAAHLDRGAISCRTRFPDITTPHSPALVTAATGIRYLSWTDPAGHLNVGELDSGPCADTHAMTLTHRITITNAMSTAGPAIIDDGTSSSLDVVLAWTDTTGTVTIGTYRGASTLTHQTRVITPVGVAGAPGLGATVSDLYLGFIGTDGIVYHAYSEGCVPACFHVTATTGHAVAGYGITSGAGDVWAAYVDTGHRLQIERY